jgi:hypothetical protein
VKCGSDGWTELPNLWYLLMRIRAQGLYGWEAVRSVSGPGIIGSPARMPGKEMLARVALLLFRTAYFVLALYGVVAEHEIYVVLFSLLFLHSLLHPQLYLKPNLLGAYLLFTVVFYFYRFVMGWNDPDNSVYIDPGPMWVRVIKDFVWIAFVFAVAGKGLLRRRLDRSTPLWFTFRGRVMAFATLLYIIIPVVGLSYHGGLHVDGVLTNVRYPLEYIPIIFLLPFLLSGDSSTRYLKSFVPLGILALAFLPYEMFSGKPVAMGYGGIYVRYGSIFGSAYDFGLFMMLVITFLLAFLAEGALRLSPWVMSYVGACLCGLASSVSLSALLSLFCSCAGVATFAKRKLVSLLILGVIGGVGAGSYFLTSETDFGRFLTERVKNLSSLRDTSSYLHAQGVKDTWEAIRKFSGTEYLLGSGNPRALLGARGGVYVETYYEAVVYLRGVPELLLLSFMIGLSAHEARRRYRLSAGDPMQRGLWLGCQLAICSFAFASWFHPYFDAFPSNFYIWFLVAIVWAEPMRNKGSSPKPGDQSGRRGARQAYAEVETLAPNNFLSKSPQREFWTSMDPRHARERTRNH